ncbi:MAG: D-aminoacyl-tRNA deacylase [Myxococcota bacterium]
MRAVVQRVSSASVRVEGEVVGAIERGLCVFVGVSREDDTKAARDLADKVVGLRIFEDAAGKMNLPLADVQGKLLAVSQFTLLGDCRKGRRPSFVEAMAPEPAQQLFEAFCAACRELGVVVETGRFRTHMEVSLVNDGPVTILLDTTRLF